MPHVAMTTSTAALTDTPVTPPVADATREPSRFHSTQSKRPLESKTRLSSQSCALEALLNAQTVPPAANSLLETGDGKRFWLELLDYIKAFVSSVFYVVFRKVARSQTPRAAMTTSTAALTDTPVTPQVADATREPSRFHFTTKSRQAKL